MFDAKTALGDLSVHISGSGAHPPEFWAERMVDRMMMVANTAPQPIRDQAMAFKQNLYEIALFYVKQCMASARAEVLEK